MKFRVIKTEVSLAGSEMVAAQGKPQELLSLEDLELEAYEVNVLVSFEDWGDGIEVPETLSVFSVPKDNVDGFTWSLARMDLDKLFVYTDSAADLNLFETLYLYGVQPYQVLPLN